MFFNWLWYKFIFVKLYRNKISFDSIISSDRNSSGNWNDLIILEYGGIVLYSAIILQISIILIDFIPDLMKWTITAASMMLLPYSMHLFSWPYGIEYSNFSLMNWNDCFQLVCMFIGSVYTIFVTKNIKGLFGILLGILYVLRGMDWFNVYIGLEIILISVLLIGKDWRHRSEYLSVQILAGTLIVIGISIFYSQNGHFGISQSNLMSSNSKHINLPLFLGLIMKAGFYPFNYQLTWYAKADKILCILLTTIISKASVYCLLYFQNTILYSWLLIVNVLALIWGLMSKKNLQANINLASNTILLILMQHSNVKLQIVYIMYAFVLTLLQTLK